MNKAFAGWVFFALSATSAAAHAQATPEELGQRWVDAIHAHSVERLKLLIHPGRPPSSIEPKILDRMLSGDLPPQFVFETRALGPKEQLAKYYWVVPSAQLNIKYLTTTPEDRARFGLGKGFAIAQSGNKWPFTICMKPLAEAPQPSS